MSSNKGTIFLIPSFLSEDNEPDFMAPQIVDVIRHTDYYLVENIRTARRYISKLKSGRVIEEMTFFTLDKKTSERDVEAYFRQIPMGVSVGVISEAGCPGVADPGAVAVTYGHKNGWAIKPLPGPSAILMALMGSGFSGQRFAFQGYLPVDRKARGKQIRILEKESATGETQLFMETPFRNNHMLEDLLKELGEDTLLCVASDISGSNELIKTLKVADWRKNPPDLYKKPTIFGLGGRK